MQTTANKKESVAASAPKTGEGFFFQPKLTINQPNDVYEQEADAMADKVMRMPDPAVNNHFFFKPGISSIKRKCTHCDEEEKQVQRKEIDSEITDIKQKLPTNPTNDVYKQQADAVAGKVMRVQETSFKLAGNKPFISPPTVKVNIATTTKEEPIKEETKEETEVLPELQAKLSFDALPPPPDDNKTNVTSLIQRKCAHCEEEKKMQRKETKSSETIADASTESYISALNGKGKPLTESERKFYEPRVGYDFSNVQLHTNEEANQSAKSINALAYTYGNNVVFGSGQYQPETDEGKKLLAHELTHVVQQTFGKRASAYVSNQHIQRNGKTVVPSQLHDPILLSSVPDYGFNVVGAEYTALPREPDVRQEIIESGISDAKTIGECKVTTFQATGVNIVYFAYENPTLGVIARAYGSYSGYIQKGSGKKVQKIPRFSVYAFIKNDEALKYRPLGGTGVVRDPQPYMDVMSGGPTGNFSDLYAQLSLLTTRLALLAKRYPQGDKRIGDAILKEQSTIADLGQKITADPAQAIAIHTAVQLVEWIDYDLSLVDKVADQLHTNKARTFSVTKLKLKYAELISKLTDADALGSYQEAQVLAERLPMDITLDALRAHGEINEGVLVDSDALIQWSDDLRGKVTALYVKRKLLTANPSNAALSKEISDDAAFLDSAFAGIQLFAEKLVATENMWRSRPGVLDTPLIDALNKLTDRVHKMKEAYDKHDAADLKKRVDSLEANQAVKNFYQALPAAMQVTQMIGRVGLATFAALASGGVGGLLAGGGSSGAVATGITLRTAISFVGTAALEAITFTTINAVGSKVLFGDKISFGSLLKDFAWNFGLFTLLRAVSGVSELRLRAAELQLLNAPVQLTVGFPLAYGWGLLRFGVEHGRWPNKSELDSMTTSSVLMLAGIVAGSKVTQRWIAAAKTAKSLPLFYREYGWAFDALENTRSSLSERILRAESAGKGNDQAELDAAKASAQKLEQGYQKLLDDILKDRRFNVDQIRKELNELHADSPDIASELVSEVLGIPGEIGIRRVAKASYSYPNGNTNALEKALKPNYIVEKSANPVTGLKILTAKSIKAPTLVFTERSAGAIDFNTSLYDVQKLMMEFSIYSVEAQKMLWRLLNENGIAQDARQATITTRQRIKEISGKAKKGTDEALSDLYKTGSLRSSAPAKLVAAANTLELKGILKSAEWLDARGLNNQRGVVGEWLAEQAVPPGSNARALRRVTVLADIYEDAAGTIPAKNTEGTTLTNASAAEADLVYVRDVSGSFEVDTTLNVKASGEKGMFGSATMQNENFKSLLGAKQKNLAEIKLNGLKRFASIKSITALDGNAEIVITGKLKAASGATFETVGPKGAGGFSKSMKEDTKGISTITSLLAEKQLIDAGQY